VPVASHSILLSVSQHDALLDTCDLCTCDSVLVFYTHHRPHLAHRDMEFFDKAQRRGWTIEKTVTDTFPVSWMISRLSIEN
jgi:nicotinamide N-methyltransferase